MKKQGIHGYTVVYNNIQKYTTVNEGKEVRIPTLYTDIQWYTENAANEG